MRATTPLGEVLMRRVLEAAAMAHLWDNVAVAVLLAEVASQRTVNRPLWFDLLRADYAAVPGLDLP